MLAPMMPSPMNPTFMVAPPGRLRLRLEDLRSNACRRHGGGPAGIEGHVGDDLADLVFGHDVGQRALDMALQLVTAVHGGQRGHRDETPVALGQAGTLPDVSVEDLLAQIDELGNYSADFLSCRDWCGRRHVVPPVLRGAVQAILMMPGSICWKRSATCGSWPATISFSLPASASMVSNASSISGRLVMICTGWRVSTL